MVTAEAISLFGGSTLGAFAVAVLRISWSLPQRSLALNVLGWGMMAAGVAMLGSTGGAWGIAVGAIIAMLAAGLLLLEAAVRSPQRRRPNGEPAPPGPVQANDGLALARRISVFLLVVPGAFVAAILVALAALGISRLAGWAEANALALAFWVFPLAWTGILLALMFRDTLRSAAGILAALAGGGGFLAWVLT